MENMVSSVINLALLHTFYAHMMLHAAYK